MEHKHHIPILEIKHQTKQGNVVAKKFDSVCTTKGNWMVNGVSGQMVAIGVDWRRITWNSPISNISHQNIVALMDLEMSNEVCPKYQTSVMLVAKSDNYRVIMINNHDNVKMTWLDSIDLMKIRESDRISKAQENQTMHIESDKWWRL